MAGDSAAATWSKGRVRALKIKILTIFRIPRRHLLPEGHLPAVKAAEPHLLHCGWAGALPVQLWLGHHSQPRLVRGHLSHGHLPAARAATARRLLHLPHDAHFGR